MNSPSEMKMQGAGAAAEGTCACCRRRLDGPGFELRGRLPLLDAFAKAVGPDGPSASGDLACSRCRDSLAKMHRVDDYWNRLRRSFLATLDGEPPDEKPVPPDLQDLPDLPDLDFASDSDDEPLYKLKSAEIEVKQELPQNLREKFAAANLTIKKVAPDKDGKIEIKSEPNHDEDKIILSGPSRATAVLTPYQLVNSNLNSAALKRPNKNKDREIAKKTKKEREALKCGKCSATFKSQNRLDLHMSKHSGNKAPYICEICGVGYKHKKACDIHIGMHNGVSPFKCAECGKIFPSKGALSRHEAIHTGIPNYQCDLCGKSFIHTSSFKMHKLSHSGVKPHTCSKCGLSLMTRSHLKRHQRVHSGEKRHACEVCGKKFSERYNLYAHQKSHDVVAPRKLKNHDCTVCEATFNRRNLLDRHMEMIHNCVSDSGPKKSRNTMNKLLKQQAMGEVSESSVIKVEPQVTLVEVEITSSPPPARQVQPQTNGVITSTAFTTAGDAAYTNSTTTMTSENNPNTIQGNHNTWLVNYHLANDYPLRMHGVDYAGYLNRQ